MAKKSEKNEAEKEASYLNSKFVVYYDLEYPTSWIDDITQSNYQNAEILVDNLINRGFTIVNAQQLENWMTDFIEKEKTEKHVVVFSQDVVPETVYFDKSDAIIRNFLNEGGYVVWIGDIPFLQRGWNYIPKRLGGKEERQRYSEGLGLNDVYAILGSFPAFAFSEHKVQITNLGRNHGLSHRWYSMRPIHPRLLYFWWHIFKRKKHILTKSILMKPLRGEDVNPQRAKEENALSYSAIKSTTEFLMSYFSLPTIILAFFAFMFGGIVAGLNLSSGLIENNLFGIGMIVVLTLFFILILRQIFSRKKYASAWIKDFQNGGKFIRLWDYRPKTITNEMCEDLYNLATNDI